MSVKKKLSKAGVWHEPTVSATANDVYNSGNNHADEPCATFSNHDFVEPEDTIRNMISDNDFYRFVLFKQHYEKYVHLSQKYEETKNMVYNLEEKYCEIKAERDELRQAKLELEQKLQSCEHDLLDKDSELFAQMEKVIRLEEDIEKLQSEKERLRTITDQLEKEKKAAYAQLQQQTTDSELMRRRLEQGRIEIVRQLTKIADEKTAIENENVKLRRELQIAEQRNFDKYFMNIHGQRRRADKNIDGLQKQVSDLKLVARKSASLGSQFRKGMKHIANCTRRKCTVCEYTKAIFGATSYENPTVTQHQQHKQDDHGMLSCFPFPHDKSKQDKSPRPIRINSYEDDRVDSLSIGSEYVLANSPVMVKRNSSSEHSLLDTQLSSTSSTTTHSYHLITDDNVLSYIDEVISQQSDSDDIDTVNCDANKCGARYANQLIDATTSRPFSNDSGFYSDGTPTKSALSASINCDFKGDFKDNLNDCDKNKLERSKWTRSFRKFISKVTKK